MVGGRPVYLRRGRYVNESGPTAAAAKLISLGFQLVVILLG